MKTTGILLLTALLTPLAATAATPPAAAQIAAAVLAAPAGRRAGAAVLGYDESGKIVKLRKGSNELICLADNPAKEKFSVACYHQDLEPYMARGRELTAAGVTGKERYDIRWQEIKEGKLSIPKGPHTLYVLTGSSYDAATGKIADRYLRWVLYVPNATVESTGLPTNAGPSVPWLMYPGTPGAHIMISPKREK